MDVITAMTGLRVMDKVMTRTPHPRPAHPSTSTVARTTPPSGRPHTSAPAQPQATQQTSGTTQLDSPVQPGTTAQTQHAAQTQAHGNAGIQGHAPVRDITRPPTRRDPRRPGGPSTRAGGSTGPAGTRPPGTRNATTPPPGSPALGRAAGTAVPAQGAPIAGPTAYGGPAPQGAPARALQRPLSPVPTASRMPATTRRQSGPPGTAPLHSRNAPTAPARPATVPTQTRRFAPQPRPTDLFADRLVLVLSGQRPVHWMLRHTVGQAYDDLARLAERGPLRTRGGVRPVVRDIGYYVPSNDAIEAFARIAAGDRLRAMAFRLELGQDHRWRCTAVELGATGGGQPRTHAP
ncbi:Rv3235 family protein [Streptomyces sp. NPDC096205]|uniref:Rv3235 family protein n=1 Tax=Streptomyces sp. NPDC096205 TaxID=3366081 RepID=UPI0037F2460C